MKSMDDADLLKAGIFPKDPLEGTVPVKVERVPRLSDALIAGQKLAFAGAPKNPLRTGFSELDLGLRTLGSKEVTMLAADSGIGKSTLSTQAMLHAAACGYGGVYLNLEMSQAMYGLRTLANFIKVPVNNARVGDLKEGDHQRMIWGVQTLVSHAKRIALANPSDHSTMPAIKKFCEASATQLRDEGSPLKLIVVDHVLQVRTSIKNNPDAEGKARADFLKELAETFDCHVLALVHITREGSKTGKMPTKNDLASSEWFNRHADNILIFHQARTSSGTFANAKATLSCQKARWGAPFAIELDYQGGFFYPWSLNPKNEEDNGNGRHAA